MRLRTVDRLVLALPVLTLWMAHPDSAGAEPQRIIIAHRGASGYLPENTLEAVTAARFMNPRTKSRLQQTQHTTVNCHCEIRTSSPPQPDR